MVYFDPGIFEFLTLFFIYLGVGFLTDSIRGILVIFRRRNYEVIP